MRALLLEQTVYTPKVVLDPEKGIYEFEGTSFPDNAESLYSPILNWLRHYGEEATSETVVDMKFIYFDASSSKKLIDVMHRLEDINEANGGVKIRWHYNSNDLGMKEIGDEYASMIGKVPFEFVYHLQ